MPSNKLCADFVPVVLFTNNNQMIKDRMYSPNVSRSR
jgi:hypothetical protein